MKPQRDAGLRQLVREMGSWGWCFRRPWAIVTIPVVFIWIGIGALAHEGYDRASESRGFAQLMVVTGVLLLVLSWIALNDFPAPLGDEECVELALGEERCRLAALLEGLPSGNPLWVDWFQRSEGFTVVGGIVVLLVGLVWSERKRA